MNRSTSLRAQLLRGLRAVDARNLVVSSVGAPDHFFAAVALPAVSLPRRSCCSGIRVGWSAFRVLRHRSERTELRSGRTPWPGWW